MDPQNGHRHGEQTLDRRNQGSSDIFSKLPIGSLIALALSALWLAVFFAAGDASPVSRFGPTATDALMGELAAFGPVGLIWLVYAAIASAVARKRSLELNERTLRAVEKSAGQTEALSRTVLEMGRTLRGTEAEQTARQVRSALLGDAARLAQRTGLVADKDLPALWQRTAAGDVLAFSSPFLDMAAFDGAFADKIARAVVADQIAATAMAGFLTRYETVVPALEKAGASDAGLRELREGPIGALYDLFAQAAGLAGDYEEGADAPEPPANGNGSSGNGGSGPMGSGNGENGNGTPSPGDETAQAADEEEVDDSQLDMFPGNRPAPDSAPDRAQTPDA